jgi:hypothetical protein
MFSSRLCDPDHLRAELGGALRQGTQHALGLAAHELAAIDLGPSSLLKFVASAGEARRKVARNRSVWGIHEDFEPLSNAASPSAAEFQQTARHQPSHDVKCVGGSPS